MQGMHAKPRLIPNLEHGLMTPAKNLRNSLKTLAHLSKLINETSDETEKVILMKELESEKGHLHWLNRLANRMIQQEAERQERLSLLQSLYVKVVNE